MPAGDSVPSTRTRYSFSTSESRPISRRATRPSCVKTMRPGGVDVEPARRVPGRAGGSGLNVIGARSSAQRFSGRISTLAGCVAVLGLARDVADRLVEEDRHLLALVPCARRIDLDARVRRHARAERIRHRAVDLHPAVLDPLVGFAPRAEAELAHALRQPRILVLERRRGADGLRQRAGAACDGRGVVRCCELPGAAGMSGAPDGARPCCARRRRARVSGASRARAGHALRRELEGGTRGMWRRKPDGMLTQASARPG